MNIKLAAALLAAGLVLAACAAQTTEVSAPEIAYGQDLCETCGMLIDQPQLAAASIDTAGQAHKFDEIGDMILFHAEHPTIQPKAWFVHDYETEAWLRAEDAYFVYHPNHLTTMGHGLLAFATESAAQAWAADLPAEVLSFDEARAAMATMVHANH
ncbi:MAG: nitrous oxide reductase accessory protein NosL [Anaerolineales bacterium]|nr:nitrous oxide reductase accessory protein NosL [Anaerolineales bacterium]